MNIFEDNLQEENNCQFIIWNFIFCENDGICFVFDDQAMNEN